MAATTPRERLSAAANVLLALCIVVMTALLVRREFFPPRAAGPAPPPPRRVENWTELAAAGRVMGPADAPVKIVEFSDFQCPACAGVQPALRALRARYPGQVAVVYRHFPLSAIHPHAEAAAVAAECAGEQGRWEAFHDALFAAQAVIGTRAWDAFAREAGVPDSAAFRACVAGGAPAERVRADARLALRTGMQATPTLIVNGTMVSGGLPLPALEQMVREALAKAR